MNNTHKLLLAIADAIGMEVEEVGTFDREGYDNHLGVYNEQDNGKSGFGAMTPPRKQDYESTDYKVTKKASGMPVDIGSGVLAQHQGVAGKEL